MILFFFFPCVLHSAISQGGGLTRLDFSPWKNLPSIFPSAVLMNLQSLDIFTKLAVNVPELAGAANTALTIGPCIVAALLRSSNWMRAVPLGLDRNNFPELFPVIISP